MAFTRGDKPPQFADLKGMLAQSKQTDNALYQTIQILIDRLDQLENNRGELLDDINDSVTYITNIVNILMNNTATFATTDPEETVLPNSSQLVAGTNVTFDKTVPHKLKINAAGGSGGTGGMNLDYLGNYVQGPVYNDGDIVLGADGVLYMCTVDGTITPPEPWPGQGISVNGTIDAKYWVVSPHTQLTNERALDSLGVGYVRSIIGEPAVVPTIPLTDTTGILPDNRLTSNVALKNIDNNFIAQSFAPGSVVIGNTPTFYLRDTAQVADNQFWRFLNTAGSLYIQKLNAGLGTLAQIQFNTVGGVQAQGFAGDGSNVTNLNASNLASGLANPARLGNGAANSSVFLRGDSTWAPVGDSFPSGMIVLSPGVPCAIGWTRITTYDGYFLKFGPGGTGGSASHGHTFTTNGAGSHSHGGNTTDNGDHSHGYGVHGQWLSSDNLNGQLNVDGGNSGNMSRGPHQHTVDVNWDANTGGGGTHNHGLNIGGVGDHSHTGGVDLSSNIPPYYEFWLCQKN